jgi:hypothetical protein
VCTSYDKKPTLKLKSNGKWMGFIIFINQQQAGNKYCEGERHARLLLFFFQLI